MFAVEKLLEIEMIRICPVPTGGTKLTGAYNQHAYTVLRGSLIRQK